MQTVFISTGSCRQRGTVTASDNNTYSNSTGLHVHTQLNARCFTVY